MIPTSADTVAIELENVSKHYASGNSELRRRHKCLAACPPLGTCRHPGQIGLRKIDAIKLDRRSMIATFGQIAVGGKVLSGMTSNEIADFRRDVVGDDFSVV